MLRLLKDPLVHFLLLGGLLFLLFAWRGEPDVTDPYEIVIADEDVQRMRQALAILHGRVPTRGEMRAILEPSIKEEILYREALALGLDQNDSQVRARLAEKMLFLTQDIAEPIEPTGAELAAYFEADPERFRRLATISFEHIFFSPSRRGAQLEADAEAALLMVREGGADSVVSDDLLLEERYERTEFAAIRRAFGDNFASTVTALQPENTWLGPIRSDYGLHLVRVTELNASYQPDLDEVGAEIKAALMAQRRLEANEAEYRELRDRYEIAVNLPEFPEAAESAESAQSEVPAE
jgi:peptidyl-prolyl cis-trans isomerase C